MLKKILISVLLITIAFCWWNWEMIQYGYFQGKGQLKVISGAKPIDEFLADPNFPDSLKQKLELSKIVRRYAIDSLGLHNSENYTKLFDQKGEILLWNLSASEPYQLKAYEWKYPILGSMPYKGFFELENAKKEAKILDSLGYDVRIRPVGGWSTLGILQDPLLSNMLERSDGDLTETIIHELTHATIFVKNEIEFNENLASFIGEKGAEKFLISHFGDSSAQHLEYVQEQADSKTLTHLILYGAKKLDSLYETFDDAVSHKIKDSLKYEQMLLIKQDLDSIFFYNERYYNIFDKNLPNNAYFMMFRRYHNQEDSLKAIYESYDQDFLKMIEGMKEKYGK